MDFELDDLDCIKREDLISSGYIFGTAVCGAGDLTRTDLSVSIPPSDSNTCNVSGHAFHLQCNICGDRGTGKHYGAISCDGCKGFFRRSIRRKQNYICSLTRKCPIDMNKRNKCRYCRLQKCYKAGMKVEAVQDTRDKIATRRRKPDLPSDVEVLDIKGLKQAADSVMLIQPVVELVDYSKLKTASIEQIHEAIADQLNRLVSWVKNIPAYKKLEINDKMLLLKSHAADHLIMGVAYRSARLWENVILLSNYKVLDKSHDERNISTFISENLVARFRALQLDEKEYLFLQGIKLFNPEVKNLVAKNAIRELQKHLLIGLEDYISEKQSDTRGRVGQLMLLIPTVETVSRDLVEQVAWYDLYHNDGIKFNNLLSELLLSKSGQVQ